MPRESLYLEADASGIAINAALLQVGDGMKSAHKDTADNAMPQPIALA